MYAKLFTSIYQGTLRGNSHGLLVFTNLLAHADMEGRVDIHPRAISEEVGLTVDEVKQALLVLESPDDESRSPEEQGRRIVRLDEHRAWGWIVVNYVKYRAIRNEDDRREQNRRSQAAWRAKQKDAALTISDVSHGKPRSAHTEADTEAYAEALGGRPPNPPIAPSALSPRPRAKRSVKAAPSAQTWDSYSKAYKSRYGVEPVRNASVNGQLAQVVGKLGESDAPPVAAFFLSHQNALYVRAMHPVQLLLRDAEKLRTEWVTGRTVTSTQANLADRTQTNANVFGPMIEQAQREAANGKR
jgi:hypothetical protein